MSGARFALAAGSALLFCASPARAEWTPVGVGDCAAAPVARSSGALPARGRCDASLGGMTAVCWDQVGQRNPALKGPGCLYRKVRAEACQGGPNPGQVYRCDGFGLASTKPAPRPAVPAKPADPPKPAESPPAEKPAPEPASEHGEVQDYLDRAAERFATKDFEGALTELRKAQALEDLAVVRFNVARCLEELERAEDAIAAYQAYLVAPDLAAGADVRQGYARQVVAFLSGRTEPEPEKLAPAWRFVRVDDCTAEESGSSDGATPAAALCVPATVGNAAICWDGVQHRNYAFPGPACVYKSAPASGCKGGLTPGLLYECTAQAGAPLPPAPATPAPAAAKPGYAWRYVGNGDCAGGDGGTSKGGSPAAEKCDAARAGKLAVCWDGMTQRHPSIKGAACSYRNTTAAACKGGANPGFVFECGLEGTPVGKLPALQAEAPPPAPATGKQAASAPPRPGRWTPAGAGDCVGGDYANSKGVLPTSARCDSTRYGAVAVCWDGAATRNPAIKGPGCAYKKTRPEACRGGPHPGALYRCGP